VVDKAPTYWTKDDERELKQLKAGKITDIMKDTALGRAIE
jgi:hypothetical protein